MGDLEELGSMDSWHTPFRVEVASSLHASGVKRKAQSSVCRRKWGRGCLLNLRTSF
jgi:hypothetical protein